MRCPTLAALVAGISLAALSGGVISAQEAEYDASTVLATVNGTDITLGHVIVLRERLPDQFQALPDETLLAGIIDQLTDQILLAETLSDGPDTDPLAVRLHLDNERRGTLAQQAVRAMAAVAIDEDDIEQAHAGMVAGFEPQPEFNASHIIVPTEEEAATLRAEIDAGADFAEVAREHSQDGAAANGGSLGWFGLGMMVPEFETEVAAMEVGEVRGPIQTQFGWHLIRLDDVRETEPPTLDAMRAQIIEDLRQTRLMEEIEALRAAATIERPETDVPAAAIRDADLLAD